MIESRGFFCSGRRNSRVTVLQLFADEDIRPSDYRSGEVIAVDFRLIFGEDLNLVTACRVQRADTRFSRVIRIIRGTSSSARAAVAATRHVDPRPRGDGHSAEAQPATATRTRTRSSQACERSAVRLRCRYLVAAPPLPSHRVNTPPVKVIHHAMCARVSARPSRILRGRTRPGEDDARRSPRSGACHGLPRTTDATNGQ